MTFMMHEGQQGKARERVSLDSDPPASRVANPSGGSSFDRVRPERVVTFDAWDETVLHCEGAGDVSAGRVFGE